MKTLRTLYPIVFSLLFIAHSVHGQQKAEISPFKFSERTIMKGEDEYSYYRLSLKSPTTYRIEGPGKLYINSRVGLSGKVYKSKASGIKIIQSQSLVKTFGIPALHPDTLKSIGDDLPTRLHRMEIEVPPGKHLYRIYGTDADQNVYVRSFFKAYPKPLWADLVPLNKPLKKQVQFSKSKTVQEYYELTRNDVYQFMLDDTSQLRIIVRPSFDNKMLDDTKISISITNKNTGQEQVYKFSSMRASDVEFTNDSKSIPGKSATFYVNFPKPNGKLNTYDVRLLKGAKSVVIRVSINKKFKGSV